MRAKLEEVGVSPIIKGGKDWELEWRRSSATCGGGCGKARCQATLVKGNRYHDREMWWVLFPLFSILSLFSRDAVGALSPFLDPFLYFLFVLFWLRFKG